ncbi:hypothetical protein [Fluviicoccus keumensis]|nr:hypothetical protein [Fluviicoccus keumensis]
MKYLLARLMLTEPEETFALYREADGGVFLLRLWEHVASDLPELDRIPGKGLSIWYRPEGEESEAVVLTFPPPQARSEAWYLGAFRNPDGNIRIFCLERGIDPLTQEPLAILAEFRPDGRANWGPTNEPRLDYFVEDVDAIIHDPSATPMAFTAISMI